MGITTTCDILTQWEQIPELNLKIICEKWRENGANNSRRSAQNNAIMVKCLKTSLTKAAPLQKMPHLSSVTVGLVVMSPLLFKLIIHLATIDSKATSKVIHKNLQTLDSYMTTCALDIDNSTYTFTLVTISCLVMKNMFTTPFHCSGMDTRFALTALSGST